MRQEHYFQTDEQVRDYVSKALALLDELAVHGELRCAMVVKVIELYAGKQIVFEQMQPVMLGGLDGVKRR